LGVSHANGEGPVDKTCLTQVGRALAQLGVEQIPAYSPQARGRSERLNRAFQDRLVKELRVAGITTLEAANDYLAQHFMPQHNATFARAPRDPASAWVPLGEMDLDTVLCHEATRVVVRDNTVIVGGRVLPIAPQPGRRSCAGVAVALRQHLDGRYTITRGSRRLGTFSRRGVPCCSVHSHGRDRRAPPRRGTRDGRVCHSFHRSLFDKAVRSFVKRKRTDRLSTTVRGTVNVQRSWTRRPALVRTLLIVVLGGVAFLAIEHFFGTTARPQGRAALVLGLLSITVGLVMVLALAFKHVPNSNLRMVGIMWGLMGVSAGLGILVGAAGYNWLLGVAAIVSIVFWLIARRHLRKALDFARQRSTGA
jgi:hypothetical protein